MTEYELMNLSEQYDEAIDLSDFTTEEIQEMADKTQSNNHIIKEKYFEFYDDVKCPTRKKQDW